MMPNPMSCHESEYLDPSILVLVPAKLVLQHNVDSNHRCRRTTKLTVDRGWVIETTTQQVNMDFYVIVFCNTGDMVS